MDFFFAGKRILAAPPRGLDIAPAEEYTDFDGSRVRVFDVPQGAIAACGDAAMTLRDLFLRVPEAHFRAAARASQVLHWRRTFRFCPACGAPLARKQGGEMAMRCPACQADYFPRIDPAVIVAIEFDGRLLLAERIGDGGQRFFSLIAGFVEPGETLEEAVRREVREEVGLSLSSLEYLRSQPWPFPSQLMVGFRAQAAGGAIAPDGREVRDARWFAPAELPANLPQPLSIARRMIDAWVAGKLGIAK